VVQAPAAGIPFTVSVTVTDPYGCNVSNQLTTTAASEGAAELLEHLCQLRHLILKYWFLEPIWSTDRDLGETTLQERDVVRLEGLSDLFSARIAKLRKSFDQLDKESTARPLP
jgi:hypothetical protein